MVKSHNIGVFPSENISLGFNPDISDSEFNVLRPKDEVLLYTMEITDKDLINKYLRFCIAGLMLFLLSGI